MNANYRIKAADGQIYGPAPVEDIKQWMADGRVDGDTQMCRSDQQQWVAAGDLPRAWSRGNYSRVCPSASTASGDSGGPLLRV